MALAKCKECGQEVSTKAKTCPNCGTNDPVGRSKKGCLGCLAVIGVTAVLIIIVAAIISSSDNETGGKDRGLAEGPPPTEVEAPKPAPKAPPPSESAKAKADKIKKGKAARKETAATVEEKSEGKGVLEKTGYDWERASLKEKYIFALAAVKTVTDRDDRIFAAHIVRGLDKIYSTGDPAILNRSLVETAVVLVTLTEHEYKKNR